MTILQFEDYVSDKEEIAQQAGLTVKCSWCGEIIRLDSNERALAMCEKCFEGVLEEFLRTQQANNPPSRPSDR